MGAALSMAAVELGHEVTVVSGPVEVEYPSSVRVIPVVSTEEMLVAAEKAFEDCDGLIGAAAPCDYRPEHVEPGKIAKTGEPLLLHLIETEDVVATLAANKGDRWVVGFALETEDHRLRALAKLEQKACDLIVSNGVAAIDAAVNSVEIIDPSGEVVCASVGAKESVARDILNVIQRRLIEPRTVAGSPAAKSWMQRP
jgi:phosphopantothenoylcysteine decarboxylase/phosphopantothenate--cysteine ligase